MTAVGEPGDESGRRRTALVTGASAGIGAAFAEEFARHGYDVVLTARREDRLRELATRLEREHGIRARVLTADLARRDAPRELAQALEREGIVVDALVNNAGYGVPGRYLRSPWETHDAFLQVMTVAVAELTHRLLPGMVARRFGRIINVASLAGLVPASAGHTLYGASKIFLVRFSEALALEVAPHGVHVSALCPGFTYSEFHDVNGMRPRVSRLPAWLWMDAVRVAREGYAAVDAGRSVYIPGRINRAIAGLSALLPGVLIRGINRWAGRAYRDSD
ncbi:MAG: SDR family oxidoreductase [Vicinamibacterales bacterium]